MSLINFSAFQSPSGSGEINHVEKKMRGHFTTHVFCFNKAQRLLPRLFPCSITVVLAATVPRLRTIAVLSLTALLAATVLRLHIIVVLSVRYAIAIIVSAVYADIIADPIAISIDKILSCTHHTDGSCHQCQDHYTRNYFSTHLLASPPNFFSVFPRVYIEITCLKLFVSPISLPNLTQISPKFAQI
nr:hypothetical membrane protein [uncultured archaeon]